ncbi:MAG: type I-C CRISPR-associated protein Cas5 [Dehalococcoidia bacterium]|nr:type I-C CRISPR-associated protein Cas5 [Dehalococcoidia bacterium]
MERHSSALSLRVWGELGCFTRPELKAERVSYPVISPSAARGVLEAIYWHPEMQWVVRQIDVLNPIAYFSILRNEITSRQSDRVAATWAKDGRGGYDAAGDRSQRHTLALRDVAYVIHADVRVAPGIDEHPAKFRDQFRRRVERGQCFATPYLGCREFSASFGPADQDVDKPIAGLTMDLGRMLLDIDYTPGHQLKGGGLGKPRFFDAKLQEGVLLVPDRFAEAA